MMSLTCLMVIGCEANAEISSPEKSNQKPVNLSVESTPKSSPDVKGKQSKYTNQGFPVGIVNPAPVNQLGSFMTLTPTGQTNALNNPLYELRLYANGQLVNSFLTVSGRAQTQFRNRHQSGTEAPLPDGRYTVAKSVTPGTIAEAGDRFLPIRPQFKTGRTDLGFHIDPSFEKNNGEDGTSGCIGLISRDNLDNLLSFVRTYRPQFLDVKIQ